MKKFLKAIYALLPFKKEVYSLIRFFWRPGESVYKHLHFTSAFTVKIDSSRKFRIHNGTQIENAIFWEGLTGKWEKESMKLWLRLCEFSTSIVDIGANTGIYALVAKSVNPKANVYAFEPHPLFFKTLQKNIALNNFDIAAHQNAVSDSDGSISIEDYTGKTPSISVESVSLDSFTKRNNIKNIDLLKIDVETHEPQVLDGFLEYLPQFKPTFLIEILNNNVAEHIYNAVSKYDYVYFNIDERNGIRQTDKIEKSDYFNYLLCSKETAQKLGLIASK